MLKLIIIEDKKLKIELKKKYYNSLIDGADVALVIEDKICGLATYVITDTARIMAVAIDKDIRGKGIGDFFIRSILNMLTFTNLDIVIDYVDKYHYYDKFNFKLQDNELKVASSEIVFPCKCKE